FLGIIAWAWFSLMTPQQMAYGVWGVQLNTLIAAIAIAAIIIRGDFTKFRFDKTTVLLLSLGVWLFFSQIRSMDPGYSNEFFQRFEKTLLFAILVTQTVNTPLKLNALVWVFVLSIGFFATKGAIFTIITLGQFHVQGLPNTVLEDNNHLGIAMATSLPMILYLRTASQRGAIKLTLTALFLMTVIAILGTQSRGAFLSLIAFSLFFWVSSKRKFVILAAGILIAAPAISFMPESWTNRMETITDAGEDASFMGRVDAWIINAKLAVKHPLTGAGLRNSYQESIARTVDAERTPRAAHSIYFELLGGAGFIGLTVYAVLLGSALLTAIRLARSRLMPGDQSWSTRFANLAMISLVVFYVGGASTSMEMWDGYLLLIALIAATEKILRSQSDSSVAAISWRGESRQIPTTKN
ncbi:MAG: putative O-glycosylation ligase, exosortase A system-associated, partial [Parvularculaceae bacterium]